MKQLFHASSASFQKFKPRPTWFSLNKKDAKGWHTSGSGEHASNVTYIVEYTGNKIASVEETASFAKKVWPNDDFIYSMFDEAIGEWDIDEVKIFIKLLIKAGFGGAYINDYDPNDFSQGYSTSMVVFDPSENINIIGQLSAF